MTDESKQIYIDWFNANQIPFETDIEIDGVKVFIHPTAMKKNVVFLARGDNKSQKKAMAALRKKHYKAFSIRGCKPDEVKKKILFSIYTLKGKPILSRCSKIAEYSEEMINKPTKAELLMREYLLSKDIFFETQKPIKGLTQWYIVDFLVDGKLVVEIDGGYHNNPIQEKKDERRDSELKQLGYEIKRIKNEDVYRVLDI